jgi:hypothetical protein
MKWVGKEEIKRDMKREWDMLRYGIDSSNKIDCRRQAVSIKNQSRRQGECKNMMRK